MKHHKLYKLIPLIFIIIFTLTVYSPSFNCGFINWDDTEYINNKYIQGLSLENLKEIFNPLSTKLDSGNYYHPILLFTFAMDYSIWKLNPAGFHITNMLLFISNLILIYLITSKLYDDRIISFITTLLFAIHPIHSEPVLWITGRALLLTTSFSLLAFYFFISFNQNKQKYRIILSLACFLLALLSHPIIIGFPVILIIYLYSFKIINKKSICEIVPFFLVIISFEGSLFFMKAQSGRLSDGNINIWGNLIKAITVFGKYIKLLLWPHNLSAIYTLDKEHLTPLYLFIMFISIISLCYTFKKDKELFFPIAWFLIFYIPVSNLFIPVGLIMADRYIYFPSIGFFICFSIIIKGLLEYKWKNTIKILLILIIIMFSILTVERCRVWKDSISLWSDVLHKYPNVIAFNNRGRIYYDLKDYNKAIDDFTSGLNLYPHSIDALINRGLSYYRKEDYDRALKDYNMALNIKPDGDIYHNRGDLYNKTGDYEKAIKDYSEAIKINPHDEEAYGKRGNIYIKLKKTKEALEDLTGALEYKKDGTIFYNRAIAWEMSGEYEKALRDYSEAIDLNPEYKEAYNNRGLIYVKFGMNEEAIKDYTRAIEISPDAVIYKNRGIAYGIMRKYDKAVEDFTGIITIDKNNVEAYNYRAITYFNMGEYKMAQKDVETLKKLGYKMNEKFLKDLSEKNGKTNR